MLFELTEDATVDLTAEEIIAASRSLPDGDGSRSEVIVENRPIDAVSLISAAARTPPEKIAARAALLFLEELGFTAVGQPTGRSRQMPERSLPEPRIRPSSIDPAEYPARDLRRLRGEWVALQANKVLAHDRDLRSLIAQVNDADSTIVWVSGNPEAAQ